jgi:hypothetical protein
MTLKGRCFPRKEDTLTEKAKLSAVFVETAEKY